jgi:sialate O-acetylesterase
MVELDLSVIKQGCAVANTRNHSGSSEFMKRSLFAPFGFLLISPFLRAEVRLASPFTDHMVLQRDRAIPVWGAAEPGEQVTVEFGGQKQTATAGLDGKWRLSLTALPASVESRTLAVKGSKTPGLLELTDVLVGEVWLASGQSNMVFTVSKKLYPWAGVRNEEAEIAAANYPLIRMFTGAAAKAYEPQATVKGEWQVCSPETVPGFSAIGYLFARDLQKEIGVPVGILALSFGASTAEAWIPRETLKADPKLKPMVEHFDAAVKTFRESPPAAIEAPPSQDVSANAKSDAAATPRKKAPRDPVQDQHNATVLFNGMIAPVIPYAIRGAIWYQGESIVGGAEGRALYPHVQATLIRDWRKRWGEGNFPFYIVQLAGQEAESNSPVVREAQATVLALENTGMVVTTDIGEAKNVHPHNKQDVGDRLARLALAKVYDRTIEWSGPVFESFAVEGAAIRVTFSHANGGLVAKGGPLKWFEIAGADGKFVPAEAKIEGATVVISAAAVSQPVTARYAWVNFPDGSNLYNAAGLPAAQFRTDAPKLLAEY